MKDKQFNFILPIFWLFSLIACVFLFAFTSHAEDSYFPMQQNENNTIDTNYYSIFDTRLDSENNYIFIRKGTTYSDGVEFYYVTIPKTRDAMIYGEVSNNGYQFSLYGVGSEQTYFKNGRLTIMFGSNEVYNLEYQQNPFTNFRNLTSSVYSSSVSYVSNFKLYSNNTDNAILLLKYGPDDPDPIGQGHAIPPDPFEDPTLATGSNHTLPREVPESPIINNYSWTTYNSPSIDTTNLESLLESFIYVVNYLAGWLRDNLAGEFSNLLSNIQSLIQFIVNTIQYYGGLIISTIQNGIETFYNNMVSLFEPLVSTVSYITAPIDSDVINDSFESTNFYGIKTQFVNTFTSFDNAFDIAEPDTFTIVFNVQNITPLYNLGVHSPVTVDLGTNFLSIRAALRTFLWIFVTFGSVFVVEHGLSNWIRGARKE